MEADGGEVNPTERADTFCPPDLQRFAELYGNQRELLEAAVAWAESHQDAPGPRGEGGFYAGYFRDLDGNKLNAFCVS